MENAYKNGKNLTTAHLHHRCIDAGSQTLDYREREEPIFGRFSVLDSKFLFDVVLEVLTAPQHARRRRANLDVELPHGVSVVHGVEGCDFIDPNSGQVQVLGHVIHRGDGQPSRLTLGKIQQG